MNLTISGYSTALFATWYFIEELNLLFDCGDGLIAALLQKSRKIEHVFISHPDRDHLTGLLQLNQLNAREGYPVIHYPRDSSSFPFLKEFSARFDPHVKGTLWEPLVDRGKVWIKKDIYVQALRNNHVRADEHTYKSFGFKVVQVKTKLKPEYVALPPMDIRKAIDTLGKEATHTNVETILLSYSGDTPAENFDYWDHSRILIHEATFLEEPADHHVQTHRNKHSTLDEVLRGVAGIQIEKLILGHFSSRYSAEEIDEYIKAGCEKYNITIPVYRLLPGQTTVDILSLPA